MPRILGGDHVALTQHAERTQSDILKIADGRGNQIQRAGGERRQCGVHEFNKTELRCEGNSFHFGYNRSFRLVIPLEIGNILDSMSAMEATAEVFVTAFKSLKRPQREAVLERMLTDEKLSEDLADTLALEARRHQPRQPFRQALKELKISL